MSSLNKVMLIGHLGRDPEVRTMPSGDRMTSFSLATSESWKDKATGEKKEATEWHQVVVFNDGLVNVVEKFCRKGSKIFVEGALRTRKYVDRDGAERKATEIVLARFRGEIRLLDAKKDDSRYDGGEAAYGAPKMGGGGAAQQSGGRAMDLDDDIPF